MMSDLHVCSQSSASRGSRNFISTASGASVFPLGVRPLCTALNVLEDSSIYSS